MATWIGLIFVGLLIGCVHAEQEPMQEQLVLDGGGDLAAQVKSLQQNVTDLWIYIYRLKQAIEQHMSSLSGRQAVLEHQQMHLGGHHLHGHDHTEEHSHSESGHHHEPLTSGSDHHDDHSSSDHHHHDSHGSSEDHHHDDHSSDQHHDEHGSSDHHHDEHGSSDHHHDEHGSSDHHHGDHDSDHRHDDHGSSDEHHDDHHHESHTASGDHQHTDDHHDEHHHGHHSTSESHSHVHINHTDSDHHHHQHEDQSQTADEQQSVEVVEKPITATVVRSHHHSHVETQDRTGMQNRNDTLNLLGGHHHHHHHHHSHQDHSAQSYDATKVTIPKQSDYRQYTFATCDVHPNRVIAPELQQDVRGQVSFWQRKTGGPLNIHVRLRGFAIGDHHAHQQQEQANETPVHGAGHRHGFHVHEFGDLSAGCQSAGAHYNPHTVNHGGPKASERHVGDLGNIECDDHGVTNIVFADPVASLMGDYSIVGKALVIHSDVDDYGLNTDDPESLRSGNAGTRIACCVIQSVPKLTLPTYKSMKTATNHQP